MTTGHVRSRELAPIPARPASQHFGSSRSSLLSIAQLTAHLGALTPLATPTIPSLWSTVSWQGQETIPQGAHTECFGLVIWQKKMPAGPLEKYSRHPPPLEVMALSPKLGADTGVHGISTVCSIDLSGVRSGPIIAERYIFCVPCHIRSSNALCSGNSQPMLPASLEIQLRFFRLCSLYHETVRPKPR